MIDGLDPWLSRLNIRRYLKDLKEDKKITRVKSLVLQ